MSARRLLVVAATLVLLAFAVWLALRLRRGPGPASGAAAVASSSPAPVAPADVIGPFFVGLSSLDVEANERAGRAFEELAKKLPDEPAVWANLGLARLRLGDDAGAEEALATAEKLAPRNDDVALLRATLDEDRGEFARAIERLRSLPQPDAAALYRLSQLLSRTGQDADLPAQRDLFARLRQLRPENPLVAFGQARLLARMEDQPHLQAVLVALEANRSRWSAAEARQFDTAKTAAAAGNFRAAGTALTFLQNLRQAAPDYSAALAELGLGGGSIGRPIRDFLRYRQPESAVSPADDALTFTLVPDDALTSAPDLRLVLDLGAKTGPSRLVSTGGKLHLDNGATLPLAAAAGPLGRDAICAADLDNDFLPDLVFAGADGLKIWMQQRDGGFAAMVPPEAQRAAFARPAQGVWALDYDADGDLDLLVACDGAPPLLLRNNGDGSFTALATLAAWPEIREVCWADFDDDGDNDLAVLDAAGRVLVAWNDRAGMFAPPQPVSPASAVALACGDVAGTGEMQLLLLDRTGAVHGARFDRGDRAWQSRELARWSSAPDLAAAFAASRASLAVADLDNNGAPDLVASAGAASAIWLNQGRARFQPLAAAPALRVMSIADLDGDGFLDLVGPTADGAAVARGRGTRGYHWQTIQTRTLGAHADNRLNTFGLGGRIEVRAGPLLATAPIAASRTHFGLGTQERIGLARIVWPNGVAQVEFEFQPDREVAATQRLKGSCPWVFARGTDGGFHFVKDFIWRSPLGMRINSQDTAGVDQTEDWIVLPGRALAAVDGAYEIRITAELWETHFFDHVALRVVDHPAEVAALVDERFVPTQPPKLAVLATSAARPLALARDQAGRDVSRVLAATDGDCVNDFPLGRFQGIAADHWIEFQLPAEVPADQSLVLVGEGWIYPTDSSLNVAISQGRHPPPQGLVLEALDPGQGWHAVSGDLGFPAGKNKTVVIPLPAAAVRDAQRLRLRTNLEIYWDRLGWAVAEPAAPLRSQTVATLTAELRHRGFSQLAAPQRRQPDVPADYAKLSGRGPRWRDLEGYYTRYGEVGELLAQTDDRYVIMNAGDEIVLRFAAPTPPPAGWVRDFVLVGDGWVKDGDFNTANSRTVGPLPSHAQPHYGGPEEPALADDPVFQAHREDWERFHTRYVTPWAFARGVMAGAEERPAGVSR